MRFVVVGVVVVLGCSSAARAPGSSPHVTQAPRSSGTDDGIAGGSEGADAEIEQLTTDNDPKETTPDRSDPVSAAAFPIGHAWQDCVKDYVDRLPEKARLPVTTALATVDVTCDEVEHRINFRTRLRPEGEGGYLETHVSIIGYLSEAGSAAWLHFAYTGESWLFAERVTVAADEYRWKSPRLQFDRDNDTTVFEDANVPLDRRAADVAARLAAAKKAIVRFEGRAGLFDLLLTDDMKMNLRLMLEGLRALGLPK